MDNVAGLNIEGTLENSTPDVFRYNDRDVVTRTV